MLLVLEPLKVFTRRELIFYDEKIRKRHQDDRKFLEISMWKFPLFFRRTSDIDEFLVIFILPNKSDIASNPSRELRRSLRLVQTIYFKIIFVLAYDSLITNERNCESNNWNSCVQRRRSSIVRAWCRSGIESIFLKNRHNGRCKQNGIQNLNKNLHNG